MDKIAVAGLAVGAVGSIAAIFAAIFAGKSPTKEDPKRVEAHLAEVDGHLSEKNKRELLISQAERVSMSVAGRNRMADPLTLKFTIENPTVTLLRIELVNKLGMLAGSVDCVPSGPLSFTATLSPEVAQRWF
jgi:hypothetical protein